MNAALSAIFFLSGAAALLFETLWFRQAGLMLGNSVWATSLVTSSFMGGLAIGNGLAGRHGARLRHPILAYAGLEATIGVTGFGLVLLLPALAPRLAPVFTPLLSHPEALNTVRLAVAFALLLAPATAMGATLPVLARALSAHDPNFGRVLGSLYGWNTIGAVAGALLGEAFLLERLGVRGTGLVAASLNGVLGLASLALWRRGTQVATATAPPGERAFAPREGRLMAAAFLAGGTLLALEIVWFRLLLLFVIGTSLSFAVMLSVVLLGIGCGGLLAALWLRKSPEPWQVLPSAAFVAGGVTVLGYAALPDALRAFGGRLLASPHDVFLAALPLMLPTSLVSGILFTLVGTALRNSGHGESRAAGALTLANTLGATVGALLGGFVLLPGLGVERSVFGLAATYGLVALLTFRSDLGPPGGRRAALASAALALVFLVLLGLFPFGLMRNHYLPSSTRPFTRDGGRIVAQREGLTETISYVARVLWDETLHYRLVTNSFSMSSSGFASSRYMRLFVHWPLAVHPGAKRALLISYGVGLTAKALTDARELESIDVVDISKDILDLGRIVFPVPGTFPLDDPRVRVHVEDGRFFLLTAPGQYDLITAEPPPPKNAGVVNLYSREYFELIERRLGPGGIATYWLPGYQMEAVEAKGIVRAFCDAFEDCSLWTGAGLEWMLVGTRDARGPVSEDRFTAQWRDPVVGARLRAVGLESPELLGATFLADAPVLREMTAGALPLDDDHPLRISPRYPAAVDPFYLRALDTAAARARFARSPLIQRLWPEALRERTLAAFEEQRMLNRVYAAGFGAPLPTLAEVEEILTRTRLRSPVLLALGASEAEVEIAGRAAARGVRGALLDERLAIDALGARDYARAAEHLRAAGTDPVLAARTEPLRVLALRLAEGRGSARTPGP